MEIRASARAIYKQGYADAMKAAALMIVSRKLDEIKALLQVTGVNASFPTPATMLDNLRPQQPLAPVVKNPCVQCGREGVYRSKPSQWNRTGSWYCRTHQVIGTTGELEDRMDRAIQPQAPPAQPPALQPAPVVAGANNLPAPGASSLSEAMGLAQVEE